MMISRTTSLVRVAAVAAALVAVSAMVLRTSSAAFSDTTNNAANNWNSGSVVLNDDDGSTDGLGNGTGGSAMFNVTNLAPGDVATRCITIEYDGSIPTADIKLYGSQSGELAQYVNVTVERGTGGGFGNCTGFTADATGGAVYTGKLNAFPTTLAAGVGLYSTTTTPSAKVFRFVTTIDDTNAAQSKSATATFSWEALETQDRAAVANG